MRPATPPAIALLMSLLPAALPAQQCPDGTQSCRVAPRPPAPNSIAVFPFSSRSPDTTDSYIAEGMTEEVGNQLTKLSRLQVKAHGVVEAAWQKNRDPAGAARSLGVAWYLDGSVRHGGGQLLINVTLVKTESGEQAWASRFLRRDADLFAAQAEVAESVAVIVGGRLTAVERGALAKRATANKEAYRLYMLGNSLMGRRTVLILRQATDAYVEAARLDPGFAAAWARMGLVYSVRGTGWEPAARDSLLVLSRRAISRALALDSSLAEAWLAKGEADHVSGDAWSAQQAFERSLRLDSLNAEAWHLYGALYSGVGVGSTALALPSHAIPLFRRALALDPTLRNTWRHLSFAMLAEGRLPEAEALLDTTLSLGEWDFAYTERATVRFLRGNAIRAFADLDAAGQSPTAPIRSLYALALGDSVRARAQLAAYHAVADSGRPNYTNQSRFAAMLGLRDEALMVLERLRSTPDPAEPRCAPNVPCSVSLRTWRLLHDPTFAPLHGDPRFEKLWQETMPKVPWLPANEQGR